ncbi:MAG TPA: UDP-N-acetylglucosamine 2-epimerase (non-hydrolyzing) [Verrucomicrobiae bacterium]|jgi:UDP-N-acetylglucosamine 2-epimerase (non-hydrolysing)|nr:UDP-N-acetylglucosamine 2-epimerase (non-hydrolyzing) [Verrucomicrobiae bacterium]
MSKTLKLLLIAGARPNFMKLAPLAKAIQNHNARPGNGDILIDSRIVHTGQHYDTQMSQVFFEELGIPKPDFNLEVGSGSHAAQTAEIMKRFEPVCLESTPDWVLVVGDVNSTMACTLVAAKMGIRVAHVEAGLRSNDRTMPEEINRIVTDALADFLLTPSQDANENLEREGVPEEKIRLVGNIMIDSLIAHLKKIDSGAALKRFSLKDRGFVYVTLHRPSNVDSKETLGPIVEELSMIAKQWPVIFPIHPRTRKRMTDFGLAFEPGAKVNLIDPISYSESITFTERARCVLTDSGGLQEESTYFGTPCLTLRPNTERPITVTMGSNCLTTVQSLRSDFQIILKGPARCGTVPPLWDGKTAERIVAALLSA